ncbi:unnamed protein product, partial [Mesorhabditis spiculigera]
MSGHDGPRGVSAMLAAFWNYWRVLLFGRPRSPFPIRKLPEALICAVLDEVSIGQWLVLQKVNRRFRTEASVRWLFPRKLMSADIVATWEPGTDENQDTLDNQIAMSDVGIWLGDRYGWTIRVTSFYQDLFILREDDVANLISIRIPQVWFQRFLDVFAASPICTKELSIKFGENHAPRMREFLPAEERYDLGNRRCIDIARLIRPFVAVKSLTLRLPKNRLFRNIQANYRCGAQVLEIYMQEDPSEIVRCRRCRTPFVTESSRWNCSICTSMWNGDWMRGGDGESCTNGMELNEVRFISNSPDLAGMLMIVDVALCPTRPQQPGMIHIIQSPPPPDGNENEAPRLNDPGFSRDFKTLVETVHNGALEFLDEAAAGTEAIKERMREQKYRPTKGQIQGYFQIHTRHKDFIGCLCRGANRYNTILLFDR